MTAKALLSNIYSGSPWSRTPSYPPGFLAMPWRTRWAIPHMDREPNQRPFFFRLVIQLLQRFR
jgi:hypothetical protein